MTKQYLPQLCTCVVIITARTRLVHLVVFENLPEGRFIGNYFKSFVIIWLKITICLLK